MLVLQMVLIGGGGGGILKEVRREEVITKRKETGVWQIVRMNYFFKDREKAGKMCSGFLGQSSGISTIIFFPIPSLKFMVVTGSGHDMQ